MFIDNEWVDATSGKTFDTYYPHDGSVIAKVAEGDKVSLLYIIIIYSDVKGYPLLRYLTFIPNDTEDTSIGSN